MVGGGGALRALILNGFLGLKDELQQTRQHG